MGHFEKKDLIDYYNSLEWQRKRNERLKLDDFKCARCGFTRALEVHHLNYERVFDEDVSRDLITLCKKCHAEIEAQKRTANPLPTEPAEHHTVYLAGKISKNGWRRVFGGNRPFSVCDCDEINENNSEVINEYMTVTGPFFIACDHGCYHGENSHGVGADNPEGYCTSYPMTQDEVFKICKAQINKAEVVFAYIDCEDCFGTLAEIGYAHALGKDIVIYFKGAWLREKMWFVSEMEQRSGDVSPNWIKEQLINTMNRALNY